MTLLDNSRASRSPLESGENSSGGIAWPSRSARYNRAPFLKFLVAPMSRRTEPSSIFLDIASPIERPHGRGGSDQASLALSARRPIPALLLRCYAFLRSGVTFSSVALGSQYA